MKSQMAFQLTLRVLMLLMVVVVVLNVIQLFPPTKKTTKPYSFAVFSMENESSAEELLYSGNNVKPAVNMSEVLRTARPSGSGAASATPEEQTSSAVQLDTSPEPLELCPQIPPGLGLLNISEDARTQMLSEVQPCGLYKSRKCLAQQNVAIIVLHNGDMKQLCEFVQHLHLFLIAQQSEHQVFVVKSGNGSSPLNRGQLMNVGFLEAQQRGWQCMVFHEPHLLPLDTRNLYRCSWYPRQLVAQVDTVDNKTYYPSSGGALAVTSEQFFKLNGFSNRASNDAVYSDFLKRAEWANYTIEKNTPLFGKYKSLLTLPKEKKINDTISNATVQSPFYLLDGLTTLVYDLDNTAWKTLYTQVTVAVGKNDIAERSNRKIMEVLLSQVLTSDQQ